MNERDREWIVRWRDARTGADGWSDLLTEYVAHGYARILETLGHHVTIERVPKKR